MTPYLEGRKYVYGDTNSSSDLSNYKIYDVQEWIDNPNKEKVELEDGVYAIAMKGNVVSAFLRNFVTESNSTPAFFRIYPVISNDNPYTLICLTDYRNPNSLVEVSEDSDLELPRLTTDASYVRRISTKGGARQFDSSLIKNPIVKGCILMPYDDGGGSAK